MNSTHLYFGMLICKFPLYSHTYRVDEPLCVHCAPQSKEKILYNIKPGGKGGGGAQSIMLIAQSSMHILYMQQQHLTMLEDISVRMQDRSPILRVKSFFCFVYLRNVFPIADTKASPV